MLKRTFGTAREQPFAGPRVVRVRELLAIDALQGKLQLEPTLVVVSQAQGLDRVIGLGSG